MNEALIEQKSQELLAKIRAAKPNITVTGTTYYVSNEGDDKADGLTPETAWKTIARVNKHGENYKLGDAVLFRCGDTFRGNVELRSITYSSYGDGPKPHLYSSPFNAAEVEWTDEGNNIYSLTLDMLEKNIEADIGNIVLNEGKDGCCFRKWEKVGKCKLELDKDYFHDFNEGKVYILSTKGAPNERWYNIELCIRKSVFKGFSPTIDNSTIDGFVIKYVGGGAVGVAGKSVKNHTLRNCEFEWVGGSKLREEDPCLYGNGHELWGGCENMLIENCHFNQVYDAAVSPQWWGDKDTIKVVNYTVRNCLFERNVYDFEYFLTQFNDLTERKHVDDTPVMFRNVVFENNICRLNGYGFGARRPHRSSSACIKGWHHQNKAENFIIKNNIFDRADYLLIEACADKDEWLPKFENNVYCQYRDKGMYDYNTGVVRLNDAILINKEFPIDENPTIVHAHRPVDEFNRF